MSEPRTANDRPTSGEGAVALVLGAVASSMAWVALQAGLKGMFAVTALVAGAALFVVVRDRSQLVLFGLVMSIGFMLHKSFGPIAIDVNGGAPSVYVTGLDVILLVLYGLWYLEGTMIGDLASAMRRGIFWVPLVGGFLTAVSMTVSGDPMLVFAELVRMGWMYLLFLYVGVHVRSRRQLWAILGGLGALVLLQVVVVLGQWVTKSALGLSFLGVPTELGERVLDEGTRHRPFGTVLHPVFMGATVAPIGIIALGLAIGLRSNRAKLACSALVALTTIPLVVSNTRAAILGFAVAAPTLVLVQAARGKIPARFVGRLIAVGLLALVPAWPFISSTWHDSLKTEHFQLEVESRIELNDIAIEIFQSAPVLGVGLNGFQRSMDAFDESGLIFAGHPVHNIYLLQLAETGLVGFAGMLLVGVVMLGAAMRLARSTDPFLGSVGAGIAAVHLFFIVEEMLVFSLRQDHPLALYWLLAGVTVAALQMARLEGSVPGPRTPPRRSPERSTPPTERTSSDSRSTAADALASLTRAAGAACMSVRLTLRRRAHPRPPWLRARSRPILLLAMIPLLCATAYGAEHLAIEPVPENSVRIVFSAVERPGAPQAIYTASADGSDIVRVSAEDGADYSWPTWAFGGTKIVFTKRDGDPGSPENVYLMDADGSDVTPLTAVGFRLGQPKVSPDGTSVVLSGFWNEFPRVAIYRIDLRTLLVTNLSAAAGTPGSVDGDPRWTTDGSRIVFASSAASDGSTVPTQVWTMAPDGSDRRQITHDAFYNTDPVFSPDGTQLAVASYRGDGTPQRDESVNLEVKLFDFRLTVTDLESGSETELTRGLDCTTRIEPNLCTPADASAYVPVWMPDGRAIAYVGALGQNLVCICAASVDGSDHMSLLTTSAHEIRWFDIAATPTDGPAPPFSPEQIGEDRPHDELVFVGSRPTLDGPRRAIYVSSRDRWTIAEVPLPPALEPLSAVWAPDRSLILFTARSPVELDAESIERTPTPPGAERRTHFTLDMVGQALVREPVDRPEVAEEQVYLIGADGEGLRRVTSPWIEDYMDAPIDGDIRGNTQPDLSRDGRTMVFTNVSSVSDESAILRLDLVTGEVVNLTSGTSGAMPVSDSAPRLSPEGRTIAFTSVVGGAPQLHTMSATDGTGVRQLTDDDYTNVSPVWSPDGSSLAFVSYRGIGDMPPEVDHVAAAERGAFGTGEWQLRVIEVATGEQRVLDTRVGTPIQSPVWSTDGADVAYIALGAGGQLDLHVVAAAGGAPPRPLQVTLVTSEVTVDWR